MKVVEHHRTGTIHLTEDNLDVGTDTLCGVQLSTSPNEVHMDGEVCKNCLQEIKSSWERKKRLAEQ